MNYLIMINNYYVRCIFVFFISVLCAGTALSETGNTATQQNVTIKGTVTSDIDDMGLPGVSVVVKGATRSVITDINGAYSIAVPSDAVLSFSFIGYKTKEIAIEDRTTIDLILNEDITGTEEEVVTALSILRQKKSLGYSIGEVSGNDLVRVPQENVLNALTGKVSGVQINSTGGIGSSVSMVIRGATSLYNDNQPMFVVDGVPVANTLNNITGFGVNNLVDYGNAISDLNPEDIESISVLKGPNAAALYGFRAGNGVVMVTTKSGKNSKGLRVDVSTNTVFDIPYKFYKKQDIFASGARPYTPDDFPKDYIMNVDLMYMCGIPLNKGYYATQWHSPLDSNGNPIPIEVVGHPNNVRNFVQTGITSTNSISVSNSNEWINFRVGVTNMTNRGIYPNTDLHRNNITAAAQINITKNLTLSSNINYSQNRADNRPPSNRGTNALEHAYNFPNNIDIRLLEDIWIPGREGIEVRTLSRSYENPYFLAYEISNGFNRDRIFGNAMLKWQIIPKLSIMGRFAMDKLSERRETKIPVGYSGEPNNGAYGLANMTNCERNIDLLIEWADRVGGFNYTLSVGGNEMYAKSTYVSHSSGPRSGLMKPGEFSVSNIPAKSLQFRDNWLQKTIQSLYAFANLGWQDMVYLDLTARNDWSSTLPEEDRSHFYPSASLSVLVNQIFDLGSNVSLIKLRGGWARVGNEISPYQLGAFYDNTGHRESVTSMEFGADLGFFDHRLRFEGTHYIVDNKSLIYVSTQNPITHYYTIDIPLQSKGWEFTVGGTPIKTSDWIWNVSVNMTKVRTTLKEFAPGIERMELWSDGPVRAWTYVGQEIGDIYANKVRRVEDTKSPYYQYVILNAADTGWDYIPAEEASNKIGNYNPDFILGLNSTVSYKNFALNWTLDWRKGGKFYSQTERRTKNQGGSPRSYTHDAINPGGRTGQELRNWLVANDHLFKDDSKLRYVGGPTAEMGGFLASDGVAMDGCFVPGVREFKDANGNTIGYIENLGEEGTLYTPYIRMDNSWNFSQGSTFDADYIKLREISLTYHIPEKVLNRARWIKGVAVSVYSRNIMLWTKAGIGIDPERAFQPEVSDEWRTQFKQGIESYNVEPWVMPIGMKLNLTF